MISAAKYLWVFLILVWAGVFFLSRVNSVAISDILFNREQTEILRKDKEFWQRNSENIANVLERERSLYDEIESLKLGEVALNDNIKRLVSQSGVHDLTIETDSGSGQGNSLPIQISFKGSLKGGAHVLGGIPREFPYLSCRRISIAQETAADELKFDVVVSYQYKFVTGQQDR